jgi:hypothetical protein
MIAHVCGEERPLTFRTGFRDVTGTDLKPRHQSCAWDFSPRETCLKRVESSVRILLVGVLT